MPERTLASIAVLIVASAIQAAPKAVGVATSDLPFLIAESEVRGSGTILDREGVSTSFLPARVRLNDGSEFVLGIGSYAKWSEELVELEGASLELTNVGSSAPTVEAAGLRVSWTEPETRMRLYTDRADILTVRVDAGWVRVTRPDGESVRRVREGEAVTFSETRTDLKILVQRAPLEIARIQMAQLDFLSGLEQATPSIRGPRRRLLTALSAASAGMLSLDPRIRQTQASSLLEGGRGALVVDPERVLAATDATNTEVNSVPSQYGCGNSTCFSGTRLSSLNIFVGHVVGLGLPYPGCSVCNLFLISGFF